MARETELVSTDDSTLVADGVVDTADVSPRAPAPDTSGKRVRAVPYQNGSTVIVDAKDFREYGIDHKQVKWDYRKDHFTVKVGTGDNQISQEAADFLTQNHKETFEYMG